jgi:hypothetical protein
MANQESNPFGLSLWREPLREPALDSRGTNDSKIWLREPGLDVRGIMNSRPTLLDRGLEFFRAVPASESLAAQNRPIAPTSIGSRTVSGLSGKQAQLYRQSIKRAAEWLPKARKEWNDFINARDSGRPLPQKVARALQANFGWTNTSDNNFSLPPMPQVIDRLSKELNSKLPALYSSERSLSPLSTSENPRWINARPWYNEDGPPGLILHPDFFASYDRNNAKLSDKPTDVRARTVIHEVLHTWETTGEWDWHDVAQEDQPKIVGSVQRYLGNPASYAGLIHDLAQ